ncbi:MAG: cobalt transporter CbiM [Spirochaetota bacterium]|nr:MAG: cobalt transporter CbiM [Spirochaetota bacterium]
MHIADGILSAPVLIGGGVVAAGGTAVGLKKMDMDKIPRVAVLTAAFFVASLIHIPLGPTNLHLILNGLVGLLLGWACFPAILIGLLLQSLIFGFGGLTVLGVNTVNMATPAIIVYLVFNRFIRGNRRIISIICAALAGVFGVLLASLLTAFSLVFSGEEYINIAKIVVVGHIPLMAVEGVVNVAIIMLLRKVKPEVLEVPHAVYE